MNYRGFGWAWLALWLFAMPATAATLRVGDLGMEIASDWLRATAEEEASFESLILRQGEPGAAVEIFVPMQRARPKGESDQFMAQLEKSWRKRYGEKVELDWLETAGTRWRVCRRPSRSGDAHIFQLVALHAGEAYQLVIATPPAMDRLPDSVHVLLASVVWRETAAVATHDSDPVAPPASEPAPEPATVSEQNPPAKPGPTWRLLRQVVALPGAKSWAALADAEAKQLGAAGMVSGLGMSARPDGLDAFIEGGLWKKAEEGGEVRHPFKRQWRVSWPALPEAWQAGSQLVFDLDFTAEHLGLEVADDLTARFELMPVCGPRLAIVRWLDGLEKAGPATMPVIDKLACKPMQGRPEAVAIGVMGKEYPAGAPSKQTRQVALPLPVDWQQAIQPRARGEVRRLALVVRFQVSDAGQAPGDALFRQAVAVFIFGPEV